MTRLKIGLIKMQDKNIDSKFYLNVASKMAEVGELPRPTLKIIYVPSGEDDITQH